MLRTGLDLKLEKSLDLSALIHVARTPDGRLQLTVVPLLYGTYALKQGSGSFSLEPPAQLNPEAGLPIIRGQLYGDALKAFADYTRRRSGAPAPSTPGATPAIAVAQPVAQTTIVRVDTPEPSPTPAAASPTPAPAQPLPTPLVAQSAPSPSVSPSPAKPVETPKPAPAVAVAPPSPKPSATVPPVAAATKVPLQPFLVSAPTPTPGTVISGGSWRTYAPGKMPRGRLVTLSDANELADRGTGGERLYLRGNFVVSFSSDNRAVLRPASSLGNALASMTSSLPPRVIVEYPNGTAAPLKSATFTRDEMRPFEITGVRREPNGQINIFAREVTAE
jgi:hypothetical protein